MSRQKLIEMTRSLIAHGEAGTIEQANDIVRVPVEAYTDEALFHREKERIFKRLPLMVGPSCEIPKPGDFKTMLSAASLSFYQGRRMAAWGLSSICVRTGEIHWPTALGMRADLPVATTVGHSSKTEICLELHAHKISAPSINHSIA